jgi:hypothetical protein
MSFEKISLPENNELPLNIQESEKHAQGAESTVWKVLAQDKEAQDKLIALKQIRKEQFADDAEMKKSKEFYDFLKGFPEFGKFVPDTLYLKARMSSGDKPQGYMLQKFSEGKSIDAMEDSELYKDPAVVEQLLDFANAAAKILETTREEKLHKPDFGTAFTADKRAIVLGNYLFNPRYSTNIVISEKPDENGQQVFFVDTGANVDERTSKMTEVVRREAAGRLQELQLKRWAKKLQEILENERARLKKPLVQRPAESEG